MDYVANKEELSEGICEIKLVDIIQYLTNQRMEPSTKMIFSTMKKLGYNTKKTKLSCKFIKQLNEEPPKSSSQISKKSVKKALTLA